MSLDFSMAMDEGLVVVLVIGGTGFIGSAVVRALRIEGHRVISSSRAATTSTNDTISLDVLDRDAVMSATSGIDCVVNCYRDSQSEQESAIAIANILDCCKANGVKKLVQFSSVAVYGNAEGLVDEWTPPVEPISWYGKAKSVAERACHAKASSTFHIAILRPTLVYGPRGEEWFTSFLTSIASGHLGNLGPKGKGFANLIYVDDVAAMCATLVRSQIPPFSIAIANGSERVTFNSYFDEIRRVLGHEDRPTQISHSLMRKPIALSRRLGRGALKVARRSISFFIRNELLQKRIFHGIEHVLRSRPEDDVARRYCTTTFYVSRQAGLMNLRASTPLHEGVANSVNWARHAGIV